MTARPEPDPPPDAALVQAYRAGDERAATTLVTRHAAALGRFLAGLGAGPGEIEDLVQDSFFRAFRRLDSWRGDASFRSWLFSIASNRLRDEYRKRKGRSFITIEDRDLPARDDPESHLVARETETILAASLARLPRLQREVFLLRVKEGIGYEEIAAALGTTPGAARVHYHHAVKRLKEAVR